MDEALFARRALGVQGKAGPTRKAATGRDDRGETHEQKQQMGKPEGDKYEPTPEEMIEIMKMMRDAGFADGPPDVPEKLEVRKRKELAACVPCRAPETPSYPLPPSLTRVHLHNNHQSTHRT